MKDFNGKVAVVTGTGTGMGRALALELAKRGARLAISDINAEEVKDTAKACTDRGAEARGYALDVSDREAVYAHAEQVAAEFGRVNLVVNNAAVALLKNIEDITWEEFEWIMGINFWGVAYSSKAFLPHLIASGDGYLANVSSVMGLIAAPTLGGYISSKFAVRGFTETLRQEVIRAGYPVKVSAVHPGGIRTEMARKARVGEGWDQETLGREGDLAFLTSSEGAARSIIRGIEHERARILVGPDVYVIDALQRLLGPAYQPVTRTVIRPFMPPTPAARWLMDKIEGVIPDSRLIPDRLKSFVFIRSGSGDEETRSP
jgi:NAD(P)-dependent dehydrogenase (short-subunit alcohol dehydrogenase family)